MQRVLGVVEFCGRATVFELEALGSAMEPMGLYVKGEFISRLSRKELALLFQVLRIINTLEVWQRFHLVVDKESNEWFAFRDRIELHFILISLYKEAIKEFCHHVADGLLSMHLSATVSREISEYKAWLDNNWKQDDYLRVVERVRNDLRFHMRSSIYDKSITDGKASGDCLIGYAIGERIMDCLYAEPYSHEFSHIAEVVPDSVAAGQDKITWILNRSIEETNKFLKVLRSALHDILKDSAYWKRVDTQMNGGQSTPYC